MKEKKLPQSDPKDFLLPDDFFANQSADLKQKVNLLENWKVNMAETPEHLFPKPDGYWWKMEEGIRSRLFPETTLLFQPKQKPVFAWVLGSLGTLAISLALLFMWNRYNPESSDWQAILEQSTDNEVLGYIMELPNEDKNEMELIANTELDSEFGLPTGQYSPNQIEQVLEEASDLEELTN